MPSTCSIASALDGRLHPFVAPLGPFLDPGCRAFEQTDFGYTSFCRTLEDHRQAFLHNGWHKILSYETNAMTRDEIVRATYDVAERLNELKYPPRADRSPHVHRRAVPPGRRSTDRGEPRRRHPERAGRRPGQPPDDVWRRRVEVAGASSGSASGRRCCVVSPPAWRWNSDTRPRG